MIKTINKAFELLRDNIIIIQPLIFYLLILGFVSRPITLDGTYTHASIFALIVSVLFTAAFLAGWFYIVKLAISMKNEVYETPEEKNLAALSLLKQFFTGVGEYFVPVLFGFLIFVLAFIGFLFLAYKIGLHYIGTPELTPQLVKALNSGSYKAISDLVSAPESYQSLKTLSYWGFYITGLSVIFSFLTMFYAPAVLYDTRNPFKAIFLNFKFLFLNFFGSLIIILFLTFLNTLVSIFNLLSAMNIIFAIISLLLMFLYMSYYVMLVFLYYEEKTKDNCDSGSECIGEIESGN